MIARIAKSRGGQRCWFDRSRIGKSRRYHVFGLSRIMTAPCGEPAKDVVGCLGMGWNACYSCPVASQAAEERKS